MMMSHLPDFWVAIALLLFLLLSLLPRSHPGGDDRDWDVVVVPASCWRGCAVPGLIRGRGSVPGLAPSLSCAGPMDWLLGGRDLLSRGFSTWGKLKGSCRGVHLTDQFDLVWVEDVSGAVCCGATGVVCFGRVAVDTSEARSSLARFHFEMALRSFRVRRYLWKNAQV